MSINSRLQFFSKIFKRSSDLETYMSKASGKSAREADGSVIAVKGLHDGHHPFEERKPYLTERYQKEIELTASSSAAATDANIKARYDHVNRVFHGYPDENGVYHTGESNWFVAETGLAPVPHTTPYVLFEGNPSTGQITAIAFDTGSGLFEVPASDESKVVDDTTYYGWGDPDSGYLYTIGSSDPETPPVVKAGDPVYQYQGGAMVEFAFPVDSVVLDGFASLSISSGANMEVSDNGTTWSAWPSYPDGYASNEEETCALNGRVPTEDKTIGEQHFYAWNDDMEAIEGYYYTTTVELAASVGVFVYDSSIGEMSSSWTISYVETWVSYVSTSVSNGKLYVRGKSDETSVWGLSGAFTKVSGNVMSLVDYDDPSLAELSEDQFHGMNGLFQNCTSLTDASELELPAETLTMNCYASMFSGCTALTEAPALPATTLASSCYADMFTDCTSLTSAPALPALTAKSYCYGSMFSGCTALVIPPSLPAETLDTECYASMFYGCTSFTSTPSLPATTLAQSCYESMFSGCSSLTSAPSLPAEILTQTCYKEMFYGCTSLVNPPSMSASRFISNQCCQNMFQGCTELVSTPSFEIKETDVECCTHMFDGCSKLTSIALIISATNAKDACFRYMFQNCTSLVTIPEAFTLPATFVYERCYDHMFYGCTSLTNAPVIIHPTYTTTPKLPIKGYYAQMFQGCTNLRGPININVTWDPRPGGVNLIAGSMFSGAGTASGAGGTIYIPDATTYGEKWKLTTAAGDTWTFTTRS